jgi:hypothetical protein
LAGGGADAAVEVIESKGAWAITAPYTPPLDRVIVAEVSNWKWNDVG